MTIQILSWNIQAAKGVDGQTSVERIANEIRELADADVICLQEVLVTNDCDQVSEINQLFPDHTLVYGAAIDRLEGAARLQFGNLILCRLPLLQIVQHKLPQPAEPAARHMPRQAIEVLVDNSGSIVRIVTTHLDYFATKQRQAQVSYLAKQHDDCISRFKHPSPGGGEAQFAALPETAMSVYCGDFNMTVDSQEYMQLTGNHQQLTASDSHSSSNQLHDCWRLMNDSTPHAPTCGIFDHEQWEEGPHCRDFFFVSEALKNRVASMEVDIDTPASDHQPLTISLNVP